MPKVILQRNPAINERGQVGTLRLDSGESFFALERNSRDTYKNSINVSIQRMAAFPCIPSGIYNCVQTYSPRFKVNLYLVERVQGRSGIRFHSANFPAELQGCIALGLNATYTKDTCMVANSRKAHAAFDFALKYKPFTLEILECCLSD